MQRENTTTTWQAWWRFCCVRLGGAPRAWQAEHGGQAVAQVRLSHESGALQVEGRVRGASGRGWASVSKYQCRGACWDTPLRGAARPAGLARPDLRRALCGGRRGCFRGRTGAPPAWDGESEDGVTDGSPLRRRGNCARAGPTLSSSTPALHTGQVLQSALRAIQLAGARVRFGEARDRRHVHSLPAPAHAAPVAERLTRTGTGTASSTGGRTASPPAQTRVQGTRCTRTRCQPPRAPPSPGPRQPPARAQRPSRRCRRTDWAAAAQPLSVLPSCTAPVEQPRAALAHFPATRSLLKQLHTAQQQLCGSPKRKARALQSAGECSEPATCRAHAPRLKRDPLTPPSQSRSPRGGCLCSKSEWPVGKDGCVRLHQTADLALRRQLAFVVHGASALPGLSCCLAVAHMWM
jgi:hypothetical protein